MTQTKSRLDWQPFHKFNAFKPNVLFVRQLRVFFSKVCMFHIRLFQIMHVSYSVVKEFMFHIGVKLCMFYIFVKGMLHNFCQSMHVLNSVVKVCMFHIGVKLCMLHIFCQIMHVLYLLSKYAYFISCCQSTHVSYFVVKECIFHILLTNYACFIFCCQILQGSYFVVNVSMIHILLSKYACFIF